MFKDIPKGLKKGFGKNPNEAKVARQSQQGLKPCLRLPCGGIDFYFIVRREVKLIGKSSEAFLRNGMSGLQAKIRNRRLTADEVNHCGETVERPREGGLVL